MRIERMQASHIARAAQLYGAAFPDSFTAQLGGGFLRGFIRRFVDDPATCSFVAVDDNDCLAGFILATARPAPEISTAQYLRLAADVLLRSLLRPSLLLGLLRRRTDLLHRLRREEASSACARVTSLGVLNSLRGKGVGRLLMLAYEEAAIHQGVANGILGVDSVNRTAVRFYEKLGWLTQTRKVTAYGSVGLIMMKHLDGGVGAVREVFSNSNKSLD